MKSIYCALCGKRIDLTQKAVPSLGKVYNLIYPHNCLPEKCEFYPIPDGGSICECGLDISGEFKCTKEYSTTCEPAIEKRKEKKFNPVETKEKTPTELDKLFDSFETVKKLNGLKSKNLGKNVVADKRAKDNLRKELTTTAPANLLNIIRSTPHSIPSGDVNVEPEEG